MSEVKVGIGIHNRFDFEVTDTVTGEVVQRAHAENVVLDQGVARIVTAFGTNGAYNTFGSWGAQIQLGSGVTAPDHAQTQLATPVRIHALTKVSATANANNTLLTYVSTCQFEAGEFVGDVYREIGVGNGNTTGLNTRALIVDENDDPLTITKIDLQVITITATLYAAISHPYGANLVFPGTATNTLVNALMHMFGGTGTWTPGNGQPLYTRSGTFHCAMGSSDTAPSASQTTCVLTPIGAATRAMTTTFDTGAMTVTCSYRFPSTDSGTVREFGAAAIHSTYGDYSYGSGPPYTQPLFRLVLPIGDNSPAFDDVFAADHIAKDNTNVIDISFVLQFGSV